MNYKFKISKNSDLIARYISNLEVKNIDYTSIVEITLKDAIPERSKEELDTLARLYVLNTVQNQISVNDNTLNYIDKQLDEVIESLMLLKGKLEIFKEKKEILNLTREEETYYNRLVGIESEKERIGLELKSINQLTL